MLLVRQRHSASDRVASDAVSAMIDAEDWTLEEVTDDLQGIPRTLTLMRFR